MPNEAYTNLSVNREVSEKLRAEFKRLRLPGTFVQFALDSTRQNLEMVELIHTKFPNHEMIRSDDELLLINRKDGSFVSFTSLFLEFLDDYLKSKK
jgi:hypothetical protein